MVVGMLRKGLTCCAAALFVSGVYAKQPEQQDTVRVSELPSEAQVTLALIKRGGPFPYGKDGVVFGNYERRLPQQKRGYYHEYTVPTPRSSNRGAKRIIVGGQPSYRAEYFYTGDHYASFQRIRDE